MKRLSYLVWGSTVATKVLYRVMGLSGARPATEGIAPDPLGVLSALAGARLSRQIDTNPNVYTSKQAPRVYFGHKHMPDGDLGSRLFFYGLMCLGMAETTAVFDLAGSLITRNDSFLYALIGISLAIWLLQFPRYREFEAKVCLPCTASNVAT